MNIMVHTCILRRAVADQPLGSKVFRIISYQSICPFPDILTNFPIQMHRRHMLSLPLNGSKTSQDHDLRAQCSTLVQNATC